jgi:hypothetical protein
MNQSVATSASPTFAGMTVSTLTARGLLGLDTSKIITSTTLTNGQLLIGSTSNSQITTAQINDPSANCTVYMNAQQINLVATGSAGTVRLDLDVQTTGTVNCSKNFSVEYNGTINLASGSVSSPSLSFNSDSNAGLYRIGADNMGIACNGTK